MALKVYKSKGYDWLPPALCNAIAEDVSQNNVVSVVFPSPSQVSVAQKEFAQAGIPTGVRCHTWSQYIEYVWNQIGSGEGLAKPSLIQAFAYKSLGSNSAMLAKAKIVSRMLDNSSDEVVRLSPKANDLTTEQSDLVKTASQVLEELHQHGYITQKEALNHIIASKANLGPVYFLGFSNIDANFVALIEGISASSQVAILKNALFPREVFKEAKTQTIAEENLQAPALQTFCDDVLTPGAIFDGGFQNKELTFLEPYGETAEAESIAEYLEEWANQGFESALVVTKNPEDMWNHLVPKLVSRGMVAHASWKAPLLSNQAVASFLRFARFYWHLLEAKGEWSEFENIFADEHNSSKPNAIAGQFISLSQDWWPPTDCIDFLHSDLVDLSQKDVDNFDSAIRNNRNVGPKNLLAKLWNLDKNSERNRGALSHLLYALSDGNFSEAFTLLLTSALASKSAETQKALKKLYQLFQEVQIAYQGSLTSKHTGEDSQMLLEALIDAAKSASISKNFQAGDFGNHPKMTVDIVTYQEATNKRPFSTDVCVLANQNLQDQNVHLFKTSVDDFLEETLKNKRYVSKEDNLHNQNMFTLHLPQAALAFEKIKKTPDAKEAYSSPLFSLVKSKLSHEVLENLEKEDPERPYLHLGEEKIHANYAARIEKLEPTSKEDFEPLRLEGLPREILGKASQKDGDKHHLTEAIRLSPTSLESFESCPRKWFFERAIPHAEQDAPFDASLKGSLYHAMLKDFFESTAEHNSEAFERLWDERFSRVFAKMAGAQIELSDEEKRISTFIPRRLQELSEWLDVKDNIATLIDTKKVFVDGFEPALFEYEFDAKDVSYAEVGMKGSVDRIDVNKQGQLLIIDYKSSSKDTLKKYGEQTNGSPKHPQTYIYAKIIESMQEKVVQDLKTAGFDVPSIEVVGVLYLGVASTQNRYGQAVSEFFDLLPQNKKGAEEKDFQDLLEDVSAQFTKLVEEKLKKGILEAHPRDEEPCRYCQYTYRCPYQMKKDEPVQEKQVSYKNIEKLSTLGENNE